MILEALDITPNGRACSCLTIAIKNELTDTMNPLLQPYDLPPFSAIRGEQVQQPRAAPGRGRVSCPAGICAAITARHSGATVFVCDMAPLRLAAARRMGSTFLT